MRRPRMMIRPAGNRGRRAAKNLGCDAPPTAIDQAVEYVKSCREPVSGGFRYMQNRNVTVACTGTSILALVLAGKENHRSAEVQKAGAYMLKHPPRWRGSQFFFYEIYYGAQANFQLGGNNWSFYKPQLHEVLLRNQQSNGCWMIDAYGPNYGTSMAILALTVEYRFLPIYQRGEEPAEKK